MTLIRHECDKTVRFNEVSRGATKIETNVRWATVKNLPNKVSLYMYTHYYVRKLQKDKVMKGNSFRCSTLNTIFRAIH